MADQATGTNQWAEQPKAKDISRRKTVFVLVAALAVVEVLFAICLYDDPRDNQGAIIAVLTGLAVLTIIDRGVRTNNGAWYRRYLSSWALLPFACALLASTWMHYQKWQQSLRDVKQIATDVVDAAWLAGDAVPGSPQPQRLPAYLSLPALDGIVKKIVDSHYSPTPATGDAERATYGELVRVIAHDLHHRNSSIREERDRAEQDTTGSFGLGIVIQSSFVLWIPFLLGVAIERSRRRLRKSARTAKHDPAVRRTLEARDRRILAEGRSLFMPRFAFAVLLVLGTNYVFSPLGLRATYLMSLVDEHAAPGHGSWSVWSTSFEQAPVIVIGFVGFLIYALITATQRFVQDDLDDQALMSLLIRGMVVVLLSLALSASSANDTVARAFVFIAGVFPVRALEALAKKANIAIDPEISGTDTQTPGSRNFEGIPNLDPTKVFALRAAGIQSVYDLAAVPIDEIAGRVRIDPRLLVRAVDRAILIEAVGCKAVGPLDDAGISSATELVQTCPLPVPGEMYARTQKTLKDDNRVKYITRVLKRIAEDHEVDGIERARDKDPASKLETAVVLSVVVAVPNKDTNGTTPGTTTGGADASPNGRLDTDDEADDRRGAAAEV